MFDRVSDFAILMSVGSTIIFLADSNPQEQILSVTFVDFVKARKPISWHFFTFPRLDYLKLAVVVLVSVTLGISE